MLFHSWLQNYLDDSLENDFSILILTGNIQQRLNESGVKFQICTFKLLESSY